MSNTIMKQKSRQKRIQRIRKKIHGTSLRPRLRVFKSLKHIYAQLIDDDKQVTICSASTLNSTLNGKDVKGKVDKAKFIGLQIAKLSINLGINSIVFDRGGYIYHGRVKALSEGAREGGLIF